MSESRRRILIVDDEPNIRDALRLLLKTSFDVFVAQDGEEALQLFIENSPDLVLLDVMMPKLDGIETLKKLRENNTTTPVIMLSAVNTVKTAVSAMKWGAVDFLNKPFDVDELTTLIVSTLDREIKDKGSSNKFTPIAESNIAGDFGVLVGRSASMVDLFSRVTQCAERDTTVLITGESGTGKELIARRIHEMSLRKSGPFVALNCAAIPESLIESELFGHEKGAFTHAVERRIGHFELADGGTLFLDEIGELSLTVQVKMLRFLQEQEFYRVGHSKPIKVNTRIIAATNKNLEELIHLKLFRQDLFYRINVINLVIPPLRDRFEDIPHLVNHFLEKLAPSYGDRTLLVSPEAIERLVTYEWPGNVRELENVMECLMALCTEETVREQDLPQKVRDRMPTDSPISSVFKANLGFQEAERMFETDMIIKALKKTNYVQTKAAELLGISRRILKYKMDKLGISDQAEVSDKGTVGH